MPAESLDAVASKEIWRALPAGEAVNEAVRAPVVGAALAAAVSADIEVIESNAAVVAATKRTSPRRREGDMRNHRHVVSPTEKLGLTVAASL